MLTYSLSFAEASRLNEDRALLIVTDGKRYAVVRVPWEFECGAHGVERVLCRCGFADGEPIGNHSRNGLDDRDLAWLSSHHENGEPI